jgi:hypothetical protein
VPGVPGMPGLSGEPGVPRTNWTFRQNLVYKLGVI